ncbi:MAG: response regulator receiver protein [Candidatus Solibacter sp.]|nr:response regulator receiver protein [Candidatus Solibacter sp.]
MTSILVLEDEYFLMKFMRQILKHHTVLGASSAEEALRHFKRSNRGVNLLIANVNLPTSSGVQVALLLRSAVPELPTILTSDYPLSSWNEQDAADLKRLGSNSVIVIQKPVETQRLLNCVRELIGALPEVARTA